MKVRDVMSTSVTTVAPDTTVSEIATLMVERKVSGMPVVDSAKVVGMVSEGDLIRRQELGTEVKRRGWLSFFISQETQAKDFVKAHGLHAKDVMGSPVHTIGPDDDIAAAAQIIARHRIKRLPVIADGELVGIIARADLMRTLATQASMAPPPPPASDRSIRQQLMKTVDTESWAASAVVNVIVTDGVVHMWGVVDGDEQRRALLVAAEEVPGVKGVEDHMGVELPT